MSDRQMIGHDEIAALLDGWGDDPRAAVLARVTAERDAQAARIADLEQHVTFAAAKLRDRDDQIRDLTAERDALRAQVERVRPVVEGLAAACDRCVELADSGVDLDLAGRQNLLDSQRQTIGFALPGSGWAGSAAALRALLDPVTP